MDFLAEGQDKAAPNITESPTLQMDGDASASEDPAAGFAGRRPGLEAAVC